MDKTQLKKLLEKYQYDKEYFIEKSREIKSSKELVSNLISKNNLLNAEQAKSDFELDSIIKKQENDLHLLAEINNSNGTVESLVHGLEQPYRNILFYRYIKFMTFDEIALKMNYSTPRIYQLHDHALEQILENLNSWAILKNNKHQNNF